MRAENIVTRKSQNRGLIQLESGAAEPTLGSSRG